MREKHCGVGRELAAFGNDSLERGLMSAERRPYRRKNLLASDRHYQQAINPAITPKTIRSIGLSYLVTIDSKILISSVVLDHKNLNRGFIENVEQNVERKPT